MVKRYTTEIFDIDYDQDGEENDLPLRLPFTAEAEGIEELEQLMSDFITEKTGFCHNGFNYQFIR